MSAKKAHHNKNISKHTVSKTSNANPFSNIEDIIAEIKKGKPVIIVDDENRENEGDLVIPAQAATPDIINFMAKEGRGLICLPMEGAMADRLGLQLMGRGDNIRHRTAFTVSIEAKEGVTTGISAADRAHTIQTAINPQSTSHDIATPGHVFPLIARDGGVLERAGHTEAAVDLAKIAGYSGAGVICEIMNDDGTMARIKDLKNYAKRHDLKIGTIDALIAYRRRVERIVDKIYQDIYISLRDKEFLRVVYINKYDQTEHIALIHGELLRNTEEPVMVQIHAMDIFRDIIGKSQDNGLERSFEIIEKKGKGVIVLLRTSGQTTCSSHKKQEEEQENHDTGAQILLDLRVKDVVLLSGNPHMVATLREYGLNVKVHDV